MVYEAVHEEGPEVAVQFASTGTFGIAGVHAASPETSIAVEQTLPPLFTLAPPLVSSQGATVPIACAHRFALPTTVMALLLVEFSLIAQLPPVNLALLLILRSVPVVPSRHRQSEMFRPPAATDVAETVTVLIVLLKAPRKNV